MVYFYIVFTLMSWGYNIDRESVELTKRHIIAVT